MDVKVREVWGNNLDAEIELLSEVINQYPFVSMDTEFPGAVFKPVSKLPADQYNACKSNVDVLKLIQLGLTLSDADGNLPHSADGFGYIWEFNFSDFDPERDKHVPESIALLRRQGIDLQKNRVNGIDSARFAELIMPSGLVCNESVSWFTFHGLHDFGYLVKILTRRLLPEKLENFLGILRVFFGNEVYDVKHLVRSCQILHGGLNRVAEMLGVNRAVGKSHQAGSDSLLTWHTFRKLRDRYFTIHELESHAGILYGLEPN